MQVLETLNKRHALQIFREIHRSKVISSSELVVESGVHVMQVYRVLEALSARGLVVREEKVPEGGAPYVFWSVTERGTGVLDLLERLGKMMEE
jgi:DNA-binding HxlR family transcriptional regulator